MSAGQTIILSSAYQRAQAHRLIDLAPDNAVVNVKQASRTTDQNALMWSLLSELSRAKPEGRTHTPDTWKAIMMSACGHAVQFETGINGQPFPIGFRSSRLTKQQFSDLIECIHEYAARVGVVLTDEVKAA